MSTRLYEYAELLKERYAARHGGNAPLEDELLDRLDGVWLAMTEAERAESKQVALATKALIYRGLVKSDNSASDGRSVGPSTRTAHREVGQSYA